MPLTKYTASTAIIAALADLPNATSGLTAAQLKAKFDESATALKTYINDTLTVEVDASLTADSGALTTHKTSGDHDGRYYTETELNAGQLDTRYYTETEVDANLVTKTDLTTTRKLSASGDFTGTLNGAAIVASEPGLSSLFTAHVADNATDILNLNLNLAKGLFTVQSQITAGKQALVDMVIDSLNDSSGINAGASSGYIYDSTNKSLKAESAATSLLHFDGTDASTTFTDELGKIWTVNGNAQIDTAQKKFGTGAGLFDGTGDWIDTPDHDDFNVGSGNFSIDFWVRRNTIGTQQHVCGQVDSSATSANWSFSVKFLVGNTLEFRVTSGTTIYSATSVGTITDSNWHHIACVRDGNTTRIFIDGTADGTANVTGVTVNNSTSKVAIGRLGEFDGQYLNGWVDEFRFSKGIARWTANFTPPTTEYSGPSATVIWTPDAASATPSDGYVVADETLGTGTISYSLSRDNGTTFTAIIEDTLTDISAQPMGTTVVVKATITGYAEIKALAWGWK